MCLEAGASARWRAALEGAGGPAFTAGSRTTATSLGLLPRRGLSPAAGPQPHVQNLSPCRPAASGPGLDTPFPGLGGLGDGNEHSSTLQELLVFSIQTTQVGSAQCPQLIHIPSAAETPRPPRQQSGTCADSRTHMCTHKHTHTDPCPTVTSVHQPSHTQTVQIQTRASPSHEAAKFRESCVQNRFVPPFLFPLCLILSLQRCVPLVVGEEGLR